MENTGILYIVPTPIGNLKDITIRALEILKEVDFIAAEDTRVSKKLLKEYDIKTRLVSYHKYNEQKRVSEFIKFLKSGKNIALVSDAGTPAISDPGMIIIKECIKNKIQVQTLPGATSFVPALVNSGFDISEFYFAGFLPKKKNDFEKKIEELSNINSVIVFFESPQRIYRTLSMIHKFTDREIFIAREISKLYETNYRGLLSQLLKDWQIIEKGEFVIVLDKPNEKTPPDLEKLVKLVIEKIEKGEAKSSAIRTIAKDFGVSKNKLYEFFYKNQKG